jgi:hypothetical protein
MSDGAVATEAEIEELVSHILALRKDSVQDLLRLEKVPFSGLNKSELRERLREAIGDGRIAVTDVVAFLDEVEPGGKQHVFLFRPPTALNEQWADVDATLRRLRRRQEVALLLAAATPLLMPAELTLSRVQVRDGNVEILAVEARRYDERDKALDRQVTTRDGRRVELRAHVLHVARSTVALRWNTATRHAALHITQTSGTQSGDRNYYRELAERFGAAVRPWLDFSQFADVNLRKVIHELHRRERSGEPLTSSRRGRWETPTGSGVDVVSASAEASLFNDQPASSAIRAVETANSGQYGNFYWLPDGPVSDPLHVAIIAFDSRVHFMVPSSPQEVEHVIAAIRRLL